MAQPVVVALVCSTLVFIHFVYFHLTTCTVYCTQYSGVCTQFTTCTVYIALYICLPN